MKKKKQALKKRRVETRRLAPVGKAAGGFWRTVGVMRIALGLMTFALIAFSPSPGTPAVFVGWELWRTVIFPVLAPILLQVLLLDALMARVFMAGHTGDARLRYRRILTMNLLLSAALTLWWLPYFLALFSNR